MRQLIYGLLVILMLSGSGAVMAQTQPIETNEQDNSVKEDNNGNSTAKQKDWKDRIVVGGNLGAQFGSSTYIEVSPIVGYKVTDKFTAGIGFSYQYFSENYNDPFFVDYKASVYGPRVFLQHDILFGFFAHAEYEYSWYKFKYEDFYASEITGEVPALFIGGGYNYFITDNAKLQIMALYDLLNGPNSLYYSPWVFRIGFSTGF